MYQRHVKFWTKHLDFILIDLVCMQFAFAVSFYVTGNSGNPYLTQTFPYQIAVLTLSQLVIIMFLDSYGGILRRSALTEFFIVFKNAVQILLVAVVYLFLVHDTSDVSRLQIGFTMVFYLLLSYALRQLNKVRIVKASSKKGKKSIVLVTSASMLSFAMESLENYGGYKDYFISGVLLYDYEAFDDSNRFNTLIAPLSHDSVTSVSRAWVDEILILQPNDTVVPTHLLDDLVASGITVNYAPMVIADGSWPVVDVREIGGFKVFTAGTSSITFGQVFTKRVMDIVGGLIGCIITCVLFVVVAPVILLKSPGSVFFSQERVGRNGRVFRMYKFRSMYLDAEERKKELADFNKVNDGMMFKIDADPRIIDGDKKRHDGSPGGFGNFIRRTSIDEFPQFFNVLKGDMSLVGTRPPLRDEWERYDLRHRIRMSMKPGITGMWQVSGRSTITDFEEVVRLDRQYIDEWSLLLDIKIILMTIVVVLKGKGAE